MNIDDKIETELYENERNGFPITKIPYGWDWRRLMVPTLTVLKYNWKCKACGEKIHDDAQIITQESHRPSYHVRCWQILFERAMTGINDHATHVLRQTEGAELTPCQNVNDVQNES